MSGTTKVIIGAIIVFVGWKIYKAATANMTVGKSQVDAVTEE